MYWQRKLPTAGHLEKWKDWEKILNIRANLALVILFTISVLNVNEPLGQGHITLSREYLESDKPQNIDVELGLTVLPYIQTIMIAFNILRLVCVVVSFWKPGVCKYYLLLQMLFWSVRETALIDAGALGQQFRITNMAIHFILLAYPGWLSIFYWMIGHTYCFFVVPVIFSVHPPNYTQLLLKLTLLTFFYSLSFVLLHIIFNWVGLQYVQAELARESK